MRDRIYLIMSGAAALLIIGMVGSKLMLQEQLVVNITDRERVDGRYIVFTEQGEFTVEDSLLYLDWRASSRYGRLRVGAECDVTTHGVRNGMLSWYPNIVRVGDCRGGD